MTAFNLDVLETSRVLRDLRVP